MKNAKDIKKFFKTRTAVLNREQLYNCAQDDIKAKGYMGPWTFNAVQSLISSIPGMLLSAFLSLLLIEVQTPQINDPLRAKLVGFLSPLQTPFTLLCIVYTVAFASLPTEYLSVKNWKAASRKYLYLDAAIGFWPQLALASSLTLLSLPQFLVRAHVFLGLLVLLSLAVFAVAFFWQGTLTFYRLRAELFDYDYVGKQQEKFSVLDNPPAVKFFVLTVVVIPFMAIALGFVIRGIARIGAHVIHSMIGR